MKHILPFLLLLLFSCSSHRTNQKVWIDENIVFASAQLEKQMVAANSKDKIQFPRTLKDGKVIYISSEKDWTSGFFPGSLWYLYELTKEPVWRDNAKKYTEALSSLQFYTGTHDLGFMVGCSYGNGLRLTKDDKYEKVIVNAAKSLATRFRPVAGILQSWEVDKGWQSKRGWQCPVIIDNMMNLELLFKATQLSGDSSFYRMAVSHADKTIEHHFRSDFSSYHVIDYDTLTGKVRGKQTAQGYAHESAWARGQAWGVYGFTVCYRETRELRYLEQAEKAFNFFITHKNLPSDLIPYWDFNAPKIPNEARDASAAAVCASALYELYVLTKKETYKTYADKLMNSLSSSQYRAPLGSNGNFILMHSVGSIPHGAEIDAPLSYSDYYFLEAIKRKRDITNSRR